MMTEPTDEEIRELLIEAGALASAAELNRAREEGRYKDMLDIMFGGVPVDVGLARVAQNADERTVRVALGAVMLRAYLDGNYEFVVSVLYAMSEEEEDQNRGWN